MGNLHACSCGPAGQRRLLPCLSGAAKRRAECTSLLPRTLASEAALTDSSLTAKRRAEALQVVFFQIQSPALSRSDVAAVCTLV